MARPFLLALVCLSLGLVVAQPNFTERIVFGQSASFTGATAIAGSRLRAGLLAAFQEVNAQGGVLGREVVLISADDEYNALLVPQTAAALLNRSNLIAFIGCYGSPTTTAILPILQQYQVADVAPVTGSASFRLPFYSQLVHLRAGYNDENFAMLNHLIVELRVKRIGVFYQADSFGIPAKDGIVGALSQLGLAPSRLQSYDKNTDNVTTHDFTADATQWAGTRTQALIIYGIGDWVVNTIRYTKAVYRTLGLGVAFFVCSFIGITLNLGLAATGTDPANVFMTQVYPHPESATLLATQYRAALRSLEGPSAQLEYLSLEGYAAGRFATRILQRMTNFTRPDFLATVNAVRMTDVGDQLAGPFSSSCLDAALTLSGARSSLCNCLQGFRFVELTSINASYANVPISTLQYPISECYATPSSALQSPIIYAQVYPSGDPWAAARVREFNQGVLYAATPTRPVRFVNASFGSSANATLQLAGLVGDSLVAAAAGCVNVPDVPLPFPVFGTLQSPAVLAAPFTESTLHLLPTLQQEVYAWVTFVVQQSGPASQCAIHVLLPAGYDPTVVSLVQQSCVHFAGSRRTQVTYETFTGAFSLSSVAATQPPQEMGNVFIFGLRPQFDLPALVDVAKGFDGWKIFTPFTDVAMSWDAAPPCSPCDATLLARLHFATSLPSWKAPNSNSSLIRAVMAAANTSNVTAQEVLGYVVQTLLLDLLHQNAVVNPLQVLGDWYYSALHVVDDFTLGIYSNLNCSTGNCLCNRGAQTLAVYQLGLFLGGAGPIAAALSAPCHLDYAVPACVLDADCRAGGDGGAVCCTDAGVAGCRCSAAFGGPACDSVPTAATSATPTIVGAVVGSTCGVALLVLLYWLGRRGRKNHGNAPKDPAKPFCIVFTDIQSSTHLWATAPEVMAVALNVHHLLIRKHIIAQSCYEVKTIGDSFMCAVEAPIQALRFALAIQTELFTHVWDEAIDDIYNLQLESEGNWGTKDGTQGPWNGLRVRVGIHYGNGNVVLDTVSQSYDYYGTVVNAAARIEAVCHGGQVGVSEAVRQAVGHAIAGVEWTPLGTHTLRGLVEPLTLYQVLPAELAGRRFPPLRLKDEAAFSQEAEAGDFLVLNAGAQNFSRSESYYSEATSVDGRWAEKHPLVLRGRATADEVRKHHTIILTALQTLLAVQSARFKQDTLKALCSQLHVQNYGVDANNLQKTLHGLIQRVLPATLARCEPVSAQPTPKSVHRLCRGSRVSPGPVPRVVSSIPSLVSPQHAMEVLEADM
eukprot:EG_transcript_310